MIENITIGSIDLSSYDPLTGLKNTACVYYVEGIDRPLPLAQLVMAVCLERAAAKESEVLALMNKLSETTKRIEQLSWIENILVAYQDSGIPRPGPFEEDGYQAWACDWYTIVPHKADLPEGQKPYPSYKSSTYESSGRWTDWLTSLGVQFPAGADGKTKTYMQESLSAADVNEILTAIETKLDSLNTTSQKDLILVQSETTKRDQTCDLITAMVKSISGGNSAISANMR